MIDPGKVKRFWDARAQTYRSLAFESIANLEQDSENLKLKIELETEKVFGLLKPIAGKNILDLGAGVGQWAFRFIDHGAGSVTAVEYSAELAKIGATEAADRGVRNLRFVVSPAEQFRSTETFDIVYISGLFVYMNDDQAERLMSNLSTFCSPDSVVLLRDGTAITDQRHEIRDRYSEHLQTLYSATYRTRQEYLDIFTHAGFTVMRDENMFDEGNPLNKYPETRLRVYLFRPARG